MGMSIVYHIFGHYLEYFYQTNFIIWWWLDEKNSWRLSFLWACLHPSIHPSLHPSILFSVCNVFPGWKTNFQTGTIEFKLKVEVKVVIHPLDTMKVCAKYHGSQWLQLWKYFSKSRRCQPAGGTKAVVTWSPKSVGYICWREWKFLTKFHTES